MKPCRRFALQRGAAGRNSHTRLAMNPREIEVHIEELVLHGFDPRSRWSIADALESELHALLSQRGVPPAWYSNPERINAGAAPAKRLTNSNTAGREVAKAVFKGGGK